MIVNVEKDQEQPQRFTEQENTLQNLDEDLNSELQKYQLPSKQKIMDKLAFNQIQEM